MNEISVKRMFFGYLTGAREIMLHKNNLNKINFFPVPDGDTGSNLSSTMASIIREARYDESVKSSLISIADSALKGARGNSGIIFAQYLLGLATETIHEVKLSSKNFVAANSKAVDYAYQAISNPVEGTIITVMKEWANALQRLHRDSIDFIDLLSQSYEVLEESVKNTTQQLKVLKTNKVVDSGAKGFALFIKGFLKHLRSGKEENIELVEEQDDEVALLDTSSHQIEDIQSRYCCEAMLEKSTISVEELKQSILSVGESLLTAGNEARVKIHLHTNQPATFFEKLNLAGTITYQKVDDMQKEFDIMRHRKYPIALVTDSIADLPLSFCDEHQIQVVPLNLMLGETNYLDKLTIENKKVIQYSQEAQHLPTSSQPDYKTVENLYSFLSSYYDQIIVITVAKSLSGTFNVFSKVAEEIKEKFPGIQVIDSKLNSGAQGLIVKQCAEYIHQGMSFSEVVQLVQNDISHTRIWVNVKSIDNMIKAGRLSKKSGKVAQMLGLKPIVSLDSAGKGILDGIALSFQSSQRKVLQKIAIMHKKSRIRLYSIVHVNNPKEAVRMAEILEKLLQQKPDYIEEVSSITSISAGDGAVAVSVLTD